MTIPGKDTWTVAFSKQKGLWQGHDVRPHEDQLRVTVKPAPAEHVEWLQFTFDSKSPTDAEIALRWEKLRVPVKLAVDVNAKVLKDCRTAVAAAAADDWRTPYRAANWCFEYMNLCQSFGYLPTGCGSQFTRGMNGYGTVSG